MGPEILAVDEAIKKAEEALRMLGNNPGAKAAQARGSIAGSIHGLKEARKFLLASSSGMYRIELPDDKK